MMKKSHLLEVVSIILLLVGGLNWGLVGIFEWNFIDTVFGLESLLSRIIYALVGLSALYRIALWIQSTK
jgi:uncharacterized membrane protein YuzA (DUF378 family)